MNDGSIKPRGTVGLPGLLCALVGAVLAIGLEMLHFYDGVNEGLAVFWRKAPYYLVDPYVVSGVMAWLISFVVSWVTVYFVLASSGLWRRVMVGLMMGVLLLGLAPSLMLWGILWHPLMAFVAFSWGWLTALVYASQHSMPVDDVVDVDKLED